MSDRDYISHGPALLYVAPVGTAMPGDSVAYGVDWGGSWTRVGWTQEPAMFSYTFEVYDSEIQQSLTPVKRHKSSEAATFSTVLKEFLMQNVRYAAGGGALTTVPAGAGQHGYTDFEIGGSDKLEELTWGFEFVETIDGVDQPVRIQVHMATAVNAPIELSGQKDGDTVVALSGSALADMTQPLGERLFKVHHITAEPTS